MLNKQDERKQRIKEAMQCYFQAQEIDRKEGRQRPLIRRKNNWIRGGMGIMCKGGGMNTAQADEMMKLYPRPFNHGNT